MTRMRCFCAVFVFIFGLSAAPPSYAEPVLQTAPAFRAASAPLSAESSASSLLPADERAAARQAVPFGWWYPPPSCPPRHSEMLACSLWGDDVTGPAASALESVFQRSEQWTDASSAHDFFFSPNYEEVDIHGLVLVTSPDLFFSPLYNKRSPTKSFFLAMAPGVPVPSEAPEVFYRFHDRELYRHGKVTASRTYKAEPFRDRNTWRIDISHARFGLVEIFSRFRADGRWVYSQHNYMHFVMPQDAAQFEGRLPEAKEARLPEDWPVFSFKTDDLGAMSLYSFGMGVRSELRLEASGRAVPPHVTVFESGREPAEVPFSAGEGVYAYTAPNDRVLENLPCILKRAVVTAEFPNSPDAAVLSMAVSCTTWSGMRRAEGALLILGTAGAASALVFRCRRRFKYAHHD